MVIIKLPLYFYLWLFSDILIICIDKESMFIVILPGIDKLIWIIEAK